MARKRDKYGEWRETDLREGEAATPQLGFTDEDRTFSGLHVPVCPKCFVRPMLLKKLFGSQNKYQMRCRTPSETWGSGCDGSSNTPWMNNPAQAARVWRMNVLLSGGKL